MCKLFGMDEAMTVSLIPKSVTTPHRGQRCRGTRRNGAHTVVAVVFTGILGSIFAPTLIRLFPGKRSDDRRNFHRRMLPRGGNIKAIELGEAEGAMSGLAIGVCGILTELFSMILMHSLAAPCGQKLRHGHKIIAWM